MIYKSTKLSNISSIIEQNSQVNGSDKKNLNELCKYFRVGNAVSINDSGLFGGSTVAFALAPVSFHNQTKEEK